MDNVATGDHSFRKDNVGSTIYAALSFDIAKHIALNCKGEMAGQNGTV